MTPTPQQDHDVPQPRLRWWLFPLAGLALLAVLWGLRAVPSLLPWPDLTIPQPDFTQDNTAPLPEAYTRPTRRYGEVEPQKATPVPSKSEQPPVAEYIARGVMPQHPQLADMQAQMAAMWTGMQQMAQTLKDIQGARHQQQQATIQNTALQTQQGTSQAAKQPPQDPRKKSWNPLVTGKGKEQEAKDMPRVEATETPRKSTANAQGPHDIVHHARWAIPVDPLRTIYKSMELPGILRRSMSSDIPGIALCELSDTIYDKFGYQTPILDKGSVMILKQEGRLEYGNTRIPAKLDQIELPSGEVLVATAIVEDKEGQAGLSGRVNNHYGKLILAAAVNAVISLGSNALAGTPSGFYTNPAQQAAREGSQSISGDIRRLSEAQLKVPPTVTIKKGTPCLVQLDENVMLSKSAPVVY